MWSLSTREEKWQTKAHQNIVKATSWTRDGRLLSCGADKIVALHDPYNSKTGSAPVAVYQGKNAFTGLSHHQTDAAFAASHSAGISIYDLSRPTTSPIHTLTYPASIDTVNTVSFNPVETSILASAATDRSIQLWDLRTYSPVNKAILSLASNAVSWNPMEAFNFAAASEDHNVYIFDSRNLKRSLNILKDHVAAVMGT